MATRPDTGPLFPGRGHAQHAGQGFVDYALWGDDGTPLVVVEAKHTSRDAVVGQQHPRGD